MSKVLKRAQMALERTRKNVNQAYKPRYHLSVPAGWLNDPNGFGFFQGKCHLFYQYHPYDTVWGPMHWGHWSSEDLTNWKEEPAAMAPDRVFDAQGCFSGTALEANGKYCIAYTGVSAAPDGQGTIQQQCLAFSEDGVHVEKYEGNPVVCAAMLPDGASPVDFRDPKLEKIPGGYSMIVASRGRNGGQLLRYCSEDLLNWRYAGVYADGLGEMAECPDCFELDGCRVMVVCLMGSRDETLLTSNPVAYLLGHEEAGRFVSHTQPRDIDRGLDFYAPQTCLAPDGRRLLIGWAHAWDSTSPTHRLGHGWNGTMTLLRECRIQDGCLYQLPAKEMEARRRNAKARQQIRIAEKTHLPEGDGPCREIVMEIDMREADFFELHLMETENEHVALTYDRWTETLKIDRSQSGHPLTADGTPEKRPNSTARVSLSDNILYLRIYVDVSIVEVYANHGQTVMTCQAFPKGKDYQVSANAKGTAVISRMETFEMV